MTPRVLAGPEELSAKTLRMIYGSIRIAGFKIGESYVENRTPAAGRVFWAYGPGRAEITILGYEPHPEDRKKDGYARVNLSRRNNTTAGR